MIFPEKCSSSYTLLTDQISLSDCLNLLRYWAIYVLQLLVNQVVPFLYMTKRSEQKLIYLEYSYVFSVILRIGMRRLNMQYVRLA